MTGEAQQAVIWANGTRRDITARPLSVDYSGLRVRRTPSEVFVGRAGYRPILLLFAGLFLVLMVVLPVPGSLVDLVERVNPPGYDMLGAGTETIVDSINYHRNPEAFKAWRESGRSAEAAQGLQSSEQVARRAMIIVGGLFIAAVFWGTEALPIAGTVVLVTVLLYTFDILPRNEIPKAFMEDAVVFILGILAVAVGVSKTGLDKRIGLILLSRIKNTASFAFIFFPLLTVCASFISEHALVALLVPVMTGVYKATCTAHGIKQDRILAIYLFLGLSFAANAGGPGSPAAGARNAIMVGYLADAGFPIRFGEWMTRGLPLALVLGLMVGAYMYFRCKPKLLVKEVTPGEVVKREMASLPRFGGKEAIMAAILGLLVIAWVTLEEMFGLGGLTTMAVFAMFLFGIINWDDIREGVALDVVGLYAAAGAMAAGLSFTGGAIWVANRFLDMLPGFMREGNGLIMGVSFATATLTNFMSDGATVSVLGPIALPLAQLANVSIWKMGLMVSFASTLANVLVVGTPNNAIVFAMSKDPQTGKRLLSGLDFIKYGFPLTILQLFVMWGWCLFGYWSLMSWP